MPGLDSSRAALSGLLARREARYLLVGGVNTVVGFGLFAGFHALWGGWLPYPLILIPTYAVGISFAFTTQRLLVFRVRGTLGRDYARFALVQSSGMVLNAVLLAVIVELAGVPVVPAQAIALAVVVVLTYLGHLRFSFHRPDAPGEG